MVRMDPNHERLLQLVSEARETRGLTKQADFIKATGLGKTTIHRFERGEELGARAYRAIDSALGWIDGSCMAVLAGDEPTLADTASTSSADVSPDTFAQLRDRLPLRATYALENGRIFDTLTYDLTPTGGARVISVVMVDQDADDEMTPDERARIGRAWEIQQRRILGLPKLAWEPGDPEEDKAAENS